MAYVYVPTRPHGPAPTDGTQHVRFELRQLDDSSPALAVFTGREQLVSALGTHQPHVKIAVLDLLVQVAGADISVVVDPELKQGVPQWTEDTVHAWQGDDDE